MRSAIGIGVVLALSAPHGTPAHAAGRVAALSVAARTTAGTPRLVHSYEHYMRLVKAQARRARRAVRFAYRQLGKPYRWGGAGPRAYDCSGLAMAAWRRGGVRLPHRADLQHQSIRRKVRLRHLRPGDLVFFSGDNHVGIYVGRRRFIHAPHTGDVVRRGSLSGWRLRSFAGAARPGAPAYRAWPSWVRAFERRRAAAPTPRPEWSDESGVTTPQAAVHGDEVLPPEARGEEFGDLGTLLGGEEGDALAGNEPRQDGRRLPYGADPGRVPESQMRRGTR